MNAAVAWLPVPLGDRPATFEEYLLGVGLAPKTVHTYVLRAEQCERILAKLGSELATANAHALSEMTGRIANSHSMRGQVRCALKHWYSWQDRMDAPIRAVRVPPQPRMVCRALEIDEAKALAAVALDRWPQGGAVLLGLLLALRREEIAAAEWERFDPDMQWYRVTGKFSKTATVPVHQVVVDTFRPHRGEGYIFPGRPGQREHVAPATVWAWAKLLAREAGIESFTTHWLRHTALTTALDNTSNLRAVMEFARHEKPQTTAGYTRTTAAQLRSVSDALEFF